MKFLYSTDWHICVTTPKSRKDKNYLDTCLSKVEFLLQTAQNENVEAILLAGDMFETPNATARASVRLQRLLAKYEIPIITNVGNHDVSGGDIASYAEESMLGIVSSAPNSLITVLTKGESVQVGYATIRGFGYHEPETFKLLEGKMAKTGDTNYQIGLIHADVGYNESKGWGSIHNQKIKGVDLALFGHVHVPFDEPFKHKSGCISFNAGGLMRSKSDEIHHKPCCYLFEILKSKTWYTMSYEKIEIPILPPEVVFDVEAQEQRSTINAEGWTAALEKQKKIKKETPQDLVRRVGTVINFNDEIINTVIDNLEI